MRQHDGRGAEERWQPNSRYPCVKYAANPHTSRRLEIEGKDAVII